jgi:Double-GTPase 2
MTTAAPHPSAAPQILCPYCLEPVAYDERQLYVSDERQVYEQLDLSRQTSPLRRADILRSAYQRCRNTDGVPQHYIPVPYLTHGSPLTVAMVGDSATGKTHLLTQMIAEIAEGGLQPYGVSWQSVNLQEHQRFMGERVAPLQSGQMLEHTASTESFASFVEALLLTGPDGSTRPVAFFDLGGEDLRRTDAVLRFMLGVDALVFVVDPLRALTLPYLDPLRGEPGLTRGGDPAFRTVLDRLPRTGTYHGVAAAVVINKCDLLRFEPPADRWLAEPRPTRLSAARLREESRDAYAFLMHHAGPAWTLPFDSVLRCTLHFASATGSHDQDGSFVHGTSPRRVLEPLVSVLAMCGLFGTDGEGGDSGDGPATVGM